MRPDNRLRGGQTMITPRWRRAKAMGLVLAGLVGLAACDSQKVLDPDAAQQGSVVASIALRDALNRLVPAIPDRAISDAVGETLAPLEFHLLNGDIIHARATLWHATRILDANRAHSNPAVLAELGAIRLALWVVYDYLDIPFEG